MLLYHCTVQATPYTWSLYEGHVDSSSDGFLHIGHCFTLYDAITLTTADCNRVGLWLEGASSLRGDLVGELCPKESAFLSPLNLLCYRVSCTEVFKKTNNEVERLPEIKHKTEAKTKSETVSKCKLWGDTYHVVREEMLLGLLKISRGREGGERVARMGMCRGAMDAWHKGSEWTAESLAKFWVLYQLGSTWLRLRALALCLLLLFPSLNSCVSWIPTYQGKLDVV